MARRAIPDVVRSWLTAEIEVWQAEGMLSGEQSAGILSLYETPQEVSERKRSWAAFTLMGLAAVMVGLAALLLVGYNWHAMPSFVKLTLVFGAIILTHLAAIAVRVRWQARFGSELLFFLGCLFYGVGIWQVAQIFHIQIHFPLGVWLWAVGVLLLALCLETPLLHLLFVALMALWAGMEVLGYGDLGSWFFGRWHRVPNGAYTLPLLALPGFLWAYRRNSPFTVGLYVALLAWWLILQPLAWHWGPNAVYFVGAVGGLLLLIAQLHHSGSPFAIPYRLYGVLLTAGTLVLLSFADFNRELYHWGHRGEWKEQVLLAGPLILVLAVAILGGSVLIKRGFAEKRMSVLHESIEIAKSQWLPSAIVVLMAVLPLLNALFLFSADRDFAALIVTVLANIAMIALAVWLIRVGLLEDQWLPFAAGVVYFLLWSILRYIDLFADFAGMLGASLMFFICGASLFGMAICWRKRKEFQHG